jgi:hypothetical protein
MVARETTIGISGILCCRQGALEGRVCEVDLGGGCLLPLRKTNVRGVCGVTQTSSPMRHPEA